MQVASLKMQPQIWRRSKGEKEVLACKLREPCAVSFNLQPMAPSLLTLSICQQVLVILLHCPVVYAELVLFYRVLLMDWINGNAI